MSPAVDLIVLKSDYLTDTQTVWTLDKVTSIRCSASARDIIIDTILVLGTRTRGTQEHDLHVVI